MARYFLGSVGSAEAYFINGGRKEFAFRSTTLTTSGINISSTQDEIRAGTGAPVVFTFNHDTTVSLTLEDVLWDRKYLEMKLGGTFSNGGFAKDYYDDGPIACATDGQLTLTYEPVDTSMPCITGEEKLIVYSEAGSNTWDMFEGSVDGKKLNGGTFKSGHKYCVRYLTNIEGARDIDVLTDFIPSEVFLVITAPLYAGDACNSSQGQSAGHITFEVPRFRLDPNLDLSLAMSSNTTMSLNGNALAYQSGCNINGSKLMRIVECLTDSNWYDGLKAIYIDPEFTPTAGKDVPVWGVFKSGSPALLDNNAKYENADALNFSIVDDTTLKVQLVSALAHGDSDSMAVTSGLHVYNDNTGSNVKGRLY